LIGEHFGQQKILVNQEALDFKQLGPVKVAINGEGRTWQWPHWDLP
jgi:hypothetical protein